MKILWLTSTPYNASEEFGYRSFGVGWVSSLQKVIEEEGGTPLMWKTGHSLVKAKMKETKALLAGEMSGHIFFKEIWKVFFSLLQKFYLCPPYG